jgi:acyl transferase domain-containing protein/acyl carrier protein
MSNPAQHEPVATDIAIIGMAGRFPGARTLDQFWQNLANGVESISAFTEQDLLAEGVDPQILKHPSYVNAAGVLDDIEWFDARFFGYSPREAEIIDPQQRFFLECAWEALESAGYDPERYPGLIGVYGGAGMSRYLFNIYANSGLVNVVGGFQIMLGNDKDHLTTRAAYKLNLKGPAVTVQTACSTSLVAVCLACDGLVSFQCDMALAGGVSINLPHRMGHFYQEGGIASPDGHCRAFDAQAQGTVTGSGVGVVLLKRLADAVADGDHIRAIVKGWSVNNDGSLKVGYTAPGIDGQAQVIAMAQSLAEVRPEQISYVEAHGTGTSLGDPIEIEALSQAFGSAGQRRQFCAIGSVKTNIGHLDPAAGAAGLIKTVLALEHRQLPPSLHYQQPNPRIDFANSPFYVNTRLEAWTADRAPRRAGVSSFGMGGTNAHVILQEAPARDSAPSYRPAHLLLLSARSATALDQMSARLATHLRQHPQLDIGDVAYTLQVGRRRFGQRRALVCRSTADAAVALETMDPQAVLTGDQPGDERPVVFMFSGQGAQYSNMARELYQIEPAFREAVDRCSEFLGPRLGMDLRSVLYPGQAETGAAQDRLQETEITQPALFVLEYALAELWKSWGLQPAAMIGHSIGEYVAACLAGVFSLEDALNTVAERGRLMQSAERGVMLSVALPAQEASAYANGQVALAVVNGPAQCVLSGPPGAVEAVEDLLRARGVATRRLFTSHAFHSAMMEPSLEPFLRHLETVVLRPPEIPFVSNVTGDFIAPEEATSPGYWAAQLRQTVRFSEGLQTLLAELNPILLEVGPGVSLCQLARLHRVQQDVPLALPTVRHPRESAQDVPFLLRTLGQLWLAGVEIDWPSFHALEPRRRVSLPTYPFERQRFWIALPKASPAPERRPAAPQEVKNQDLGAWFYKPEWQPASLQQPVRTLPSTEGSQDWLLFEDDQGIGAALAARLRQGGQRVSRVRPGEAFARLDELAYTIRPHEAQDYRALLARLAAGQFRPEHIVHLWTVYSDQPQEPLAAFRHAQEVGFYSLINLVQAMDQARSATPARLSIVSNGVQDVSGREPLLPERATVLGPCLVVPQEYPHITCRHVDVDLVDAGPAEAANLAGHLLAELTGPAQEKFVAYRQDQRWAQVYRPARLPAPAGPPAQLRQRGVYLITGGLGRIGLTLAGYLAEAVQARLVLVGRSPFPRRDEWASTVAARGADHQLRRKIQRLQAMEGAGGEVLVLQADVADPDAMAAALEEAARHFGPPNGVIHAAGASRQDTARPVASLEPSACEAHFRPKAQGLLVVEHLLGDQPLDFCLLFSSLSAILGGLGFAGYAAANAFLDASAHRQHRTAPGRWISADWDGWLFEEKAGSVEGLGATLAAYAILPAEGVRAFQRVLSAPPQVVVSTGDLSTRIDRWVRLAQAPDQVPEDGATPPPAHARPDLPTRYTAPGSPLEEAIAGLWRSLLGIAQVGIYDNFFELGGHSLLAIQLISRLRDEFGVDLPVHTLFDAPTVAQLAELVRDRQDMMHEETEQLADMLDLIESLSDDEIKALLAGQEDLQGPAP